MDIDIDELRCHRDRINRVTERMTWNQPDETGCDITYLRVPESCLMEGHQEGIQEYYSRQKRKAKEQPKLRKGTKYYLRIVRRDGVLLRVDHYSGDELYVTHLAHYEDGIRYLIPFYPDGTHSYTLTYVTHWENGRVSEEYACSGGQVIQWRFSYTENNTVEVESVNAVPDGKEPILCWSKSIFTQGDTITCEDIDYWDYWMKERNENC